MKTKTSLGEIPIISILLFFPLDSMADLSCKHLSDLLGFSPSWLSRKFSRSHNGEKLETTMQKIRIIRAAIALSDFPGLSIQEVAKKVGYEDIKYFSRIFKKILGMYPDEYKRCLKFFRYNANP